LQKIAFFFGTFNPIHCGHLLIAESAKSQFGFQKILFIPAYKPPHRKTDRSLASFKDRYKMVQLAIGDNPAYEVSDIESRRSKPSYTVETLRLLVPDFEERQEKIPIIIGSDALAELGTWHQPETLIRKVRFLQACRHESKLIKQIAVNGKNVEIETAEINFPRVEISASGIRAMLKKGRNIRYHVPKKVQDYITWNSLYTDRKA